MNPTNKLNMKTLIITKSFIIIAWVQNSQKIRLIYHRPDQKEWGFSGSVTEDGKYLVISVWLGTDRKNLVFYKNLSQPDSEVVELISEFEASYGVIDNNGGYLLGTDGFRCTERKSNCDRSKQQRSR